MNKNGVIDLFCGAGGLSEGFRQSGFRIIGGVDKDKEAGETYKKNFPDSILLHEDITKISSDELLEKMKVTKEEVLVVMGGPPCQGFSAAGKRFVDDPRNVLFKEFVRIVEEITPNFFVMENVGGLLSMDNGRYLREIKELFGDIGYSVEVKLMNAADYGVAQTRKRAIFLGVKGNKKIDFPKATHSKEPTLSLLPWVTVGEAIGDLPLLGNGFGLNESIEVLNIVNHYQSYLSGNISFEEYLQFSYNEIKFEKLMTSKQIFNHWTSKSKEDTIDKFKLIPQGLNWKSMPEYLQTKSKFSNLYKRLHPDFPSVTLTNIRKAMFISPWENRLLTVREGARIQSFPDYFHFFGKINSQQQQIGNAVPPILGLVLAKHILTMNEG